MPAFLPDATTGSELAPEHYNYLVQALTGRLTDQALKLVGIDGSTIRQAGCSFTQLAGRQYIGINCYYNATASRWQRVVSADPAVLFEFIAGGTAGASINLLSVSASDGSTTVLGTILGTGSAGAPSNGDLTLTSGQSVVVGLQGHAVSATAPSSGQLLYHDGTNWVPTSLSDLGGGGGISVARDIGGTAIAPQVIGLAGIDLSTTAPTNGQVLAYHTSSSKWEPTSLPDTAVQNIIAGTNVTVTRSGNDVTINSTATSGGGGGSGIASGTSNPTTGLTDGDLYNRTDRKQIINYHGGISKWVTEVAYDSIEGTFLQADGVKSTFRKMLPFVDGIEIDHCMLEQLSLYLVEELPPDTSNYWTIELVGSATGTVYYTRNTDSMVYSGGVGQLTIEAGLTTLLDGTGDTQYYFRFTPVGTCGQLDASIRAGFRGYFS